MEQKFTHQICKQLDQSVDQLDSELKGQLVSARRAALAQSPDSHTTSELQRFKFFRPVVFWPAMAAALIAIIILPNVSTHRVVDVNIEENVSFYEMEPELLETMDLLWAVDELVERDMNAL